MRDDEMLTARQVAKMFGVNPQTPGRWDDQGKLKARHRTLGGQRRWAKADCDALLAEVSGEQETEEA